MAKMILTFFILWSAITFVIVILQSLGKSEIWHIAKTMMFAGLTALIAAILLFVFVTLF